jgi:hypothetical protein
MTADWHVIVIILIAAGTSPLFVVTGFLILLFRIREIHQLVNSQRSAMLQEILDLRKTIADNLQKAPPTSHLP